MCSEMQLNSITTEYPVSLCSVTDQPNVFTTPVKVGTTSKHVETFLCCPLLPLSVLCAGLQNINF